MIHGQVEEKGRFFQRVGAMGDDDAVDVGIASEGVDLITQAQPGVLGHVVAVDVAQLDGRQLGQMADRRYAADDLADIDASGLRRTMKQQCSCGIAVFSVRPPWTGSNG